MKRLFAIFLIFFGYLRAEYNVGDTLTVPINVFFLNLTRDYVQSDPLYSNYRFYGKVRYKSDRYYIITIDTIKYDYSAGNPPQPTTRVDVIPPSHIQPIVDSIVDVLESHKIFQRVLDSLGVSQFQLFDSDNDPRIYIVVAAGFFITSQSGSIGITDVDIKGYFDPYYSTSTIYPKHEFFVLNYKSSLFTTNVNLSIKKGILRKFLFYLYTQYVLWSINRNDNELVSDILRGAFYLASRVDLSNADKYYNGFETPTDALNTANFNPLTNKSAYLTTLYMMNSSDAIAGILWLTSLEDILGYQKLKSFFLTKGRTFSELINSELELRNISLDSLINLFHIKNLLNRFTSFPQQYRYSQPYLQGVTIYPPSVITSISTSLSTISLNPRGAFAIYALTAATAQKPLIVNFSDNAYINNKITVYKIDTITKEVIKLSDSVENSRRLYLKGGLNLRTQYVLIVSTSPTIQSISYTINDTLPPTLSKFSLIPNRFSLTLLQTFTSSTEGLYSDISANKITLSLLYPDGIVDTFDVPLKDTVKIGNTTTYYFIFDYKLPYLKVGKYLLRPVRINDALDNLVTGYSDSVIFSYLTPNSILSFDNVKIKNPGSRSIPVMTKFEKNAFGIYKEDNTPLIIKIKGEGIICNENGCFDTYKEGDYVWAYINASGNYYLSNGTPKQTFLFNIVNKKLYVQVSESAILEIYSIDGRKVLSMELLSGIYELPIKSGLYRAILRVNDSVHYKSFVVY
ncbi:MAG: hypothetical protein RMJ38_06285 [candidate division WOR-3 bacterium]|nr:hypothetical protein [candidate division WOR-3 bacterium]MDW8151031.1 hypothetical protein [candidate division WOR-3 bacterium]